MYIICLLLFLMIFQDVWARRHSSFSKKKNQFEPKRNELNKKILGKQKREEKKGEI